MSCCVWTRGSLLTKPPNMTLGKKSASHVHVLCSWTSTKLETNKHIDEEPLSYSHAGKKTKVPLFLAFTDRSTSKIIWGIWRRITARPPIFTPGSSQSMRMFVTTACLLQLTPNLAYHFNTTDVPFPVSFALVTFQARQLRRPHKIHELYEVRYENCALSISIDAM